MKCSTCSDELILSANWSISNSRKKYYICKKCNSKRQEKYRQENLYKAYKRDANKRGMSFNMSESTFERITSKNCFYCGQAPYIRNGIDRKDNELGYDLDNIVPCCKMCNRMKNIFHHDDFINQCAKIYNKHCKPFK